MNRTKFHLCRSPQIAGLLVQLGRCVSCSLAMPGLTGWKECAGRGAWCHWPSLTAPAQLWERSFPSAGVQPGEGRDRTGCRDGTRDTWLPGPGNSLGTTSNPGRFLAIAMNQHLEDSEEQVRYLPGYSCRPPGNRAASGWAGSRWSR